MKNLFKILIVCTMALIVSNVQGNTLASGGVYVAPEIEQPFSDLLLVLKFTGASEPQYGSLATMLTNPTTQVPFSCNISFHAKSGVHDRIAVDTPLYLLGEYKQNGEGVIYCTRNPATNRVSSIMLPIAIGYNGALMMENDEFLKVELTGLPTVNTFAFDMYAIESPVRTAARYEYAKISVPSGTTLKQLDVTSLDSLILPNTPALDKVYFKFSNGLNATFTRTELLYMQNEINDIVTHFESTSVKMGSDTAFVMDVAKVTQIELSIVGQNGYTCYGVTSEFHGKPSAESRFNDNLTDTTLPVKEGKIIMAEQKSTSRFD